MKKLEILKSFNNFHTLEVRENGKPKKLHLYDLVDTDFRKNGHQFGVAVYHDSNAKKYYEVYAIAYKGEVVDIDIKTIEYSKYYN